AARIAGGAVRQHIRERVGDAIIGGSAAVGLNDAVLIHVNRRASLFAFGIVGVEGDDPIGIALLKQLPFVVVGRLQIRIGSVVGGKQCFVTVAGTISISFGPFGCGVKTGVEFGFFAVFPIGSAILL